MGELGGPQDRAVAADHDDQLAVGARVAGASASSTLGGARSSPSAVGLVARAAGRAMPCPVSASTSCARDVARLGAAGVREQQHATRVGRLDVTVHLLTRHPRRARPTPPPSISARVDRGRACAQPQEELDVARRAGQRADRHRAGSPARAAAAASATVATASARSAGSRTTPPLPTRSLPDLELRLDHQHQVAVVGGARRAAASSTSVSEMNDRSPTTRSTGPPTSSRGRGRGRWCGRGRRPASSCWSRQASWP